MPIIIDLLAPQTSNSTAMPAFNFAPRAAEPTSTPADFEHSIERLSRVVDGLLIAASSEDITGFKDELRVIKAHEKLLATHDPLKKLSLAIEVRNIKAQVHAERVEFDKVAKDAYQVGCAASAGAFLLGDYQLSRQMRVVTEQSYNIGMQIAGKCGYGTLAAEGAVTNISLGSSLVIGAAAIVEAFSRQKDPIMPMLGQIVAQMARQHQEVMAMMKFQHIDLKAQIGELALDFITHFTSIAKKIDNIHELLEVLYQNIVANSIQTQHTLNSFSHSLEQVRKTIHHRETMRMVDIISEPINRLVYNGSGGCLDPDTIRELVTALLVSVKLTSKRAEVAGEGSMPNLLSMSQWEISNLTASFADYHINELRAIAAHHLPKDSISPLSLSNPSLWTYSTLALLILYRKRYSTAPGDEFYKPLRIAEEEVINVRNILVEGQQIQELLTQLRAPELYESLLTKLQASFEQYIIAYKEDLQAFQVLQAKEIEQQSELKNTKLSTTQMKALNSQGINVNGSYHNWFGGYSSFRGHNGKRNGTKSYMSLKPGAVSGDEQYQHAAKLARSTFVTTADEQITRQKTAYLGGYGFVIYPMPGFAGPVLPITAELALKIQNSLPSEIMRAVGFNLGSLYFRYFVQDEKAFHLRTYFDNTLCHELVIPYAPLFYTGYEAIWWYWVGGNMPTDASHTEVYAFPALAQDGEHYYDYYLYHPNINTRTAVLSIMSTEDTLLNNQLTEEELTKVSVESTQLILSKYEQLRQEYNKHVRNSFETDIKSSFGQAITAFFANLKCLKTCIALALHDEYENPDSDLSHLLQAVEIPGSREEMVAYLQKNESSTGLEKEFLDKIQALLDIYKMHLPLVFETPRPSYYSMVENVTEQCAGFVEEYFPTQVRVNEIVPIGPADNAHKEVVAQRAIIALLQAMLMTQTQAIHNVTLAPEVREQLDADRHGLFNTFLNQNPHLVVTATSTPSAARLIAGRSDGPVFGHGARLLGDSLVNSELGSGTSLDKTPDPN